MSQYFRCRFSPILMIIFLTECHVLNCAMFLFSNEIYTINQQKNHHSSKKIKLVLYITIPIVFIIILSFTIYFFISYKNNNFPWTQKEKLSFIISDIIRQYKVIGWEMYQRENKDGKSEIFNIIPIRSCSSNIFYKSQKNVQYVNEKDIIDEKVKSAIEKKPLEEKEEYESYIEELVLSINYNLTEIKSKGCNMEEIVSAVKEFSIFIRKVWLEIQEHTKTLKIVQLKLEAKEKNLYNKSTNIK